MTSFFAGLFRLAFLFAATALSLGAVLAVFGFASPLLDALNHLQPIWFFGTLACLLLTGVFFRTQRARALMMALTATGFLASGIIVMPEFTSAYLARPHAPSDVTSYRLMTFNVFGQNYDMEAVAAMIGDQDPDIVAFNEYYPEQRIPLHPMLAKDYPHFAICAGIGKRANVAIYARLPFETDGTDPCAWDANRRTGYLAAHFGSDATDSFTIVTTQLDWPVQVSPLAGPGTLDQRLAAMTARQQGEFTHLSNGLATMDGPLLLVGDLNSTPWSYTLRRFARDNGLTRDARGLATYPRKWHFDTWRSLPAFLPLDHVMSRGGAVVTAIHTGPESGSDHLPVIATFFVASN